jgi:hypothetical protein
VSGGGFRRHLVGLLSTAHRGRPLLLVFSEGPSLDVSECVCAEENIDEIQYVEGSVVARLRLRRAYFLAVGSSTSLSRARDV